MNVTKCDICGAVTDPANCDRRFDLYLGTDLRGFEPPLKVETEHDICKSCQSKFEEALQNTYKEIAKG